MGVCACGKTTIGKLLASELGWPFYDGDDFHSESNRAKMANGIALTDDDRKPWLKALGDLAQKETANGHSAVMACSALKLAYRNIIRGRSEGNETNALPEIRFVYLKLDQAAVENRLRSRKGHFFNAQLVKSQFEALEEPNEEFEKDVWTVDGNLSTAEIVEVVKNYLRK